MLEQGEIKRLENKPVFSILKYISHRKLYLKYAKNNICFLKIISNNLIFNISCSVVANFKDYLIFDDDSEFLRRFYHLKDSRLKMKKLSSCYEKYSKIFPNYLNLREGKYIYKNIRKKQKLIDAVNKENILEDKRKRKASKSKRNLKNEIIFDGQAKEEIMKFQEKADKVSYAKINEDTLLTQTSLSTIIDPKKQKANVQLYNKNKNEVLSTSTGNCTESKINKSMESFITFNESNLSLHSIINNMENDKIVNHENHQILSNKKAKTKKKMFNNIFPRIAKNDVNKSKPNSKCNKRKDLCEKNNNKNGVCSPRNINKRIEEKTKFVQDEKKFYTKPLLKTVNLFSGNASLTKKNTKILSANQVKPSNVQKNILLKCVQNLIVLDKEEINYDKLKNISKNKNDEVKTNNANNDGTFSKIRVMSIKKNESLRPKGVSKEKDEKVVNSEKTTIENQKSREGDINNNKYIKHKHISQDFTPNYFFSTEAEIKQRENSTINSKEISKNKKIQEKKIKGESTSSKSILNTTAIFRTKSHSTHLRPKKEKINQKKNNNEQNSIIKSNIYNNQFTDNISNDPNLITRNSKNISEDIDIDRNEVIIVMKDFDDFVKDNKITLQSSVITMEPNYNKENYNPNLFYSINQGEARHFNYSKLHSVDEGDENGEHLKAELGIKKLSNFKRNSLKAKINSKLKNENRCNYSVKKQNNIKKHYHNQKSLNHTSFRQYLPKFNKKNIHISKDLFNTIDYKKNTNNDEELQVISSENEQLATLSHRVIKEKNKNLSCLSQIFDSSKKNNKSEKYISSDKKKVNLKLNHNYITNRNNNCNYNSNYNQIKFKNNKSDKNNNKLLIKTNDNNSEVKKDNNSYTKNKVNCLNTLKTEISNLRLRYKLYLKKNKQKSCDLDFNKNILKLNHYVIEKKNSIKKEFSEKFYRRNKTSNRLKNCSNTHNKNNKENEDKNKQMSGITPENASRIRINENKKLKKDKKSVITRHTKSFKNHENKFNGLGQKKNYDTSFAIKVNRTKFLGKIKIIKSNERNEEY